MKIGILVNTDRHLDAITGITRAAIARGHEVIIFVMDEGTRLFEQDKFNELAGLDSVNMSYCDLSAKSLNVNTDGVADNVICGSQYNNAQMIHNADRLIVL